MEPLFIFMHKCDVDRSFQRIYLIGNAFLPCLNMIAKNASSDDGLHALLSGQPSFIIDGHPSQMELKICPEYHNVVNQVKIKFGYWHMYFRHPVLTGTPSFLTLISTCG
jgi:hypothetical protein